MHVTLTTAGARAFWCTGYRPNYAFMRDPRTNAAVGGCLDEEGFIAALSWKPLSFAGPSALRL